MNRALLRVLAITLGAGLGVAACGEDLPRDLEDTTAALAFPSGPPVAVPNPSGAYSATVIASGDGCAPGTWDADIGPDGHELTLHFHAYKDEIHPGANAAIASCQLEIDLTTPQNISFAVSGFRYDGHATLADRQTGSATFHKYYFYGNPVPAKELRSSLNGPFDDAIVYEDDLWPADYVWTPCRTKQRLMDSTRMVIINDPQRTGTGAIDPSGDLVAKFTLEWRSC